LWTKIQISVYKVKKVLNNSKLFSERSSGFALFCLLYRCIIALRRGEALLYSQCTSVFERGACLQKWTATCTL